MHAQIYRCVVRAKLAFKIIRGYLLWSNKLRSRGYTLYNHTDMSASPQASPGISPDPLLSLQLVQLHGSPPALSLYQGERAR